MMFIGVKSANSFRQFRIAVYGVTTILRLAWAFTLALNAFSLTTTLDTRHQIISTVMFGVNALAFVLVVLVGSLEAFHFRLASRTSTARFELSWMTFFWALEAAGASVYTIYSPSFHCDSIARLSGDDSNSIFLAFTKAASPRATTATENNTCQTFNLMTFVGAWLMVGFTLIYVVYFALLTLKASRRERSVWTSHIGRFDWTITSEPIPPKSPDMIRPEMIQRPANPHLSKDFNGSMASLPPVFVDPFQARKDSEDSVMWKPEAMEVIHYPVDRHAVMARYQPQPIQPSRWNTDRDSFRRGTRVSVLGLEGMEWPAKDHRKSKPSLSIYVPPAKIGTAIPIGAAEEDYEKIGRTMSMMIASPIAADLPTASEEPCAAIGRRMSRPFASPISSEESTGPRMAVGKDAHDSMHTRSQATSLITHGHTAVQNVRAASAYPVIQQSVQRQSTMVKEDSLTLRKSMRFVPMDSYANHRSSRGSGGILPLHNQELRPPPQRSSYQHVQIMHNRSYSAAATFRTSQIMRPAGLAPANTWPIHSSRYAPPSQMAYPSQAPGFPFLAPPPPNHSPNWTNSSPSAASSFHGSSLQGYASHSRSSSTPSFQQQPVSRPIPALLDALSPVVRNSGQWQAVGHPSQSRPWRGSGVQHPFLDDNPFGRARKESRTTEHSGSEVDYPSIPSVATEDIKQKQKNRLRKSLPRDFY